MVTSFGHKRALKDICSGSLGRGVQNTHFLPLMLPPFVEKNLDYKTQENLNGNNENTA